MAFMYQCLICSQKCANMNILMRHVKRHTKAEMLQVAISKNALYVKTKQLKGPKKGKDNENPMQTNKIIESDYICKLCNTTFLTKSDFESHCSNHYFPVFTCHFCNAQFYDKDKMKAHAEEHLLESIADCSFSLEEDYEMAPQYICMLADFYQTGYRYGQTSPIVYDPINFQMCYLEHSKKKL